MKRRLWWLWNVKLARSERQVILVFAPTTVILFIAQIAAVGHP